jgi:hypothetical protein
MIVEKPACPKCATAYIPAVKGRRAASIPVMVSKKPVALEVGDEENSVSEALVVNGDDLDVGLDDDNEDEGLIEDTSDLDDDDDDMAEIKEHVEVDLDN